MPTVVELKEALRKKGLKVSGNKAELEKRLAESDSVPSNILDKDLYIKARNLVKKRVKVWPSAYASGQLVSEYKKLGGRYSSSKNDTKGIGKWFKEEWVNVCKPKVQGKYQPCGREQSKIRAYPYCRPLHRVNKGTPMTVKEIVNKHGKEYLTTLCKKKRKEGLPENKKAKQISIRFKK